jgi:hypothetical protein
MKEIANRQSPIANRQSGKLAFGIWHLGFGLMSLVFLRPLAAHAQQTSSNGFDFGLNELGQILALPEGDPRLIAIRLVNVALEFLAIITLILVVYSGFLFLFSGGKQESISRAIGVLRSAIIGLIIILSSWAIVRFVLTSFIGAISGTSETGTGQTAPAPASVSGASL